MSAGEIAKLTWDMVLEAGGGVGSAIELRDQAAKNQSGRQIPLHPELRRALATWRDLNGGTGPVIRSERGKAMRPISIVIWSSASKSAAELIVLGYDDQFESCAARFAGAKPDIVTNAAHGIAIMHVSASRADAGDGQQEGHSR